MKPSATAKSILTVVFMLLSLLVAACSSSGSDADGDSDSDNQLIQDECSEDLDCDAGMFCSAYNTCIRSCRRDDDCRDKYCDTNWSSSTFGSCVECTSDSHCRAIAENGWCADGKYCRFGCEDCTSDELCIADRCIPLEKPDEDGENAENDGDYEETPSFVCPEPEDTGMLCEPECSQCDDENSYRICKIDGSAWDIYYCESGQFCNDKTGKCEDLLCEPYSVSCADGNAIRTCNESGSAYTDEPCPGYEICTEGKCVNASCEASEGQKFWTFDVHTEIAAADRWCSQPFPRGSAQWGEDSQKGGVLSFDGSKSHVLLPSNTGYFQEKATVMLSFYAEDVSTSVSLVAKGREISYELAIEQQKLVWRLNIEGSIKELKSNYPVMAGQWYTAAGVFDGLEMRLYLDGAIQAAPLKFSSAKLILVNNEPITIGAHSISSGGVARTFKGSIDNLFLSDRDLSEEELLYFANSNDPCPVAEGKENSLFCENLCTRTLLSQRVVFDWERFNISLYKGETFSIDAGGCADPQSIMPCVPPSGIAPDCPACPMPDKNRFSVIARINESGAPFYAGEKTIHTAEAAGDLYMGYNDDDFNGHSGVSGFSVIVEQGYCPIQCPLNMVPVLGKDVCIDRYEASCSSANYLDSTCDSTSNTEALSRPGVFPWTKITPDAARNACDLAGKRLCERDEWETSCGGESGQNYCYGDTYISAVCNDQSYIGQHAETDLTITGFMYKCVNPFGAMDLCGNASEFAGPAGSSGTRAYAGKQSGTNSRCRDYFESDGESLRTGFRCCLSVNPQIIGASYEQ